MLSEVETSQIRQGFLDYARNDIFLSPRFIFNAPREARGVPSLSYHHQPFFRARDRGIQPALAVLEKTALVDHDDKIVLRPLRLMARNGVGKFKTAIGILAFYFMLAQRGIIMFVHKFAVFQQTRLFPVTVGVRPALEHTRIEGQIIPHIA